MLPPHPEPTPSPALSPSHPPWIPDPGLLPLLPSTPGAISSSWTREMWQDSLWSTQGLSSVTVHQSFSFRVQVGLRAWLTCVTVLGPDLWPMQPWVEPLEAGRAFRVSMACVPQTFTEPNPLSNPPLAGLPSLLFQPPAWAPQGQQQILASKLGPVTFWRAFRAPFSPNQCP